MPATVSAPPERHGPQITNREAVDWSRLNAIGAIELAKLDASDTSQAGTNRAETKHDVENLELKFFPQQKSISFELVPFGNASLHCNERGQDFDLMFVASPGSDVSDQLTCSGQNFTRYQISMNYRTTATWKDNTLTLDGSARIHKNNEDGSADYVVDLHGAIQLSGAACRVIAWRQSFPDVTVITGDSLRDDDALTATPDTTCTVKKVGGA